MSRKKASLTKIIMIYILAGAIGFAVLVALNRMEMVVSFFIADIAMTLLVFGFSVLYRNSSVYDPYWSAIPFYFVIWWFISYVPFLSVFHYAVFLLISIWSWRLTLNWVRSWGGMNHEDWRYVDLATKTGRFYPLVNFFGIHLFPTLIVFVCLLPVFKIFNNEMMFPGWFYVGMLFGLVGVLFEYFADNTLAVFRINEDRVQGEVLDKGLWAWCRHPNYLGEISFWLGIAMIGIAFSGEIFGSLRGFIALILMFVLISIPLKEKRMEKRYSGFNDYKKRVPILVPRFGIKKH